MLGEQNQSKLKEYGINNEISDIRSHVGPLSQQVFVYKTKDGKEAMQKHISAGGVEKVGGQPGYDGITFRGYAVPVKYFDDLKIINLDIEWFMNYRKDLPLEMKGRLAVSVVHKLLLNGMFPLWTQGYETKTRTIQISGEDIKINGTWKIQVKNDEKAGTVDSGGSGNLFLQTHESNPFKKY